MKRDGLRALVGVVCLAALAACGTEEPSPGVGEPPQDVDLAAGRELYEERCATCHGEDLRGTDDGPPFLHRVYAPDHHPDESFFFAVENGVQPHHWDFGPMPAIMGLDRDDVAAIIVYVREVQEREGLEG